MRRALVSLSTALLFASVAGLGAPACEAVPDLRFDDGGVVPDGGRDGTSPADARADAPADDAGTVCPPTPTDAIGCCGSTPCVGKSCPSQCNKCTAKGCPAGTYCCLGTGAATCVAPGEACN